MNAPYVNTAEEQANIIRTLEGGQQHADRRAPQPETMADRLDTIAAGIGYTCMALFALGIVTLTIIHWSK